MLANKRYFVTGTNIEIGRAVAGCALLQTAGAVGYRTAGYKPAVFGSEKTPEGLHDSNALALQHNSSLWLDYVTINPYTFAKPASSYIISTQEGRSMGSLVMSAGLCALEQQADWALIEGAGGWFTPFSDTFVFADWVTQGQPPVILVVSMRFGYINHAMLTAQVIRHAGLTTAGWATNNVTSPGKRHAKYIATLTRMTLMPLSEEIPWFTENPENMIAERYMNLASLQLSYIWLNYEQDHIFN